jgi:zinc-binding alcohol dehydrogenase/oxidoreductase
MIVKGICTGENIGLPIIKEIDLSKVIGDIDIPIKYAALNHRDLWITKGLYPSISAGFIMGSDGVGIIDDKRFVLYPAKEWGSSDTFQSKHFEVLGVPSHGTFTTNVVCNPSALYTVPDYLTDAEAAAFPLAGLTAYRALFTKGDLKRGDKVLITGIGGGVALFAAQFALAVGADVYFTTGYSWKMDKALDLGLKYGVNYNDPEWSKELSRKIDGFDLIIDGAGGDMMQHYLKIINYGGKIVSYGGSQGKMNNLSPQLIFWKQASIIGSTMGSPYEFGEMIKFLEQHKIHPIIDSIYDFQDYRLAFHKMEEGSQFGKILLKL